MFAYELEGLNRLNIQPIKWGSSYRVKVRRRTGKMVFVSNISRSINKKLVAKQYNVSVETLEKHMSADYKADPKYRFYKGNHIESQLYEGIEATDFYDKLENVLSTQTRAFKVDILLQGGYSKEVISEMRSMELADKLNYPSSGYKLKVITAFKIFVYHRDHALGDSDAVIPKVIRENKHVINFPKTNNKCVFHCIAWHTFQSAKKDPRRIQAQVKEAFKRYCSFKGVKYTLSLFRGFKPIDLLQLDEVEDCFQLGINSILKPTATQHGENTVFTNEHILVSVSVCGVETQLGMDLPVAAAVPNGAKLPGYGLKDSLAIDWLIFTGSDVSDSTHRVT
ncbi:unnamed protein product [Phytophthora lilii]|uniref:Unnamed protein product n=1 Tax=Phytophthora lilii TaxID=2077276 RepID=A0A9W6TL75_9STRA|nr:unnamed protein product [Phytophthora lilii]